MYNFSGQYKTGLNISLGGATKKVDKSTLIKSARAERLKREKNRTEEVSALLLQSWYHGCRTRKSLARKHRLDFDDNLKKILNDSEQSISLVGNLVQAICFFYKPSNDYQRLVAVSQILLKISSAKKLQHLLSTDLQCWIHRIKNLLVLCGRSLHFSSDLNITIPLRMLEVFTDSKTYYWLEDSHATKTSLIITIYLVLKGYFKDLYELINTKIPSSLEPSTHPPTPFADAMKDLVLKPIGLLSKSNGKFSLEEKSKSAYAAFVKSLLYPPMSEQVCYFLIPAIAPSVPIAPLFHVIQSISDHSIWTLYSFLSIFSAKCETFLLQDIVLFVNCLRILIPTLIARRDSQSAKTSSVQEYDSDSDDCDMEESEEKVVENQCLVYARKKCFEIINCKQTVSVILSLLDHRQSFTHEQVTQYIKDLCEISYCLMSNLNFYMSVQASGLLYTMAFNQSLLRLMWNMLKSLSTTTVTGKTIFLLHLLAQDYAMKVSDELDIIPLLGSYAFLFGNTLFSVYDSDFYNEHAGFGQSLMPFSLPEVIEMSQLLKDIILGMIYRIYPNIKMHKDNDAEWHHVFEMVTRLIKQIYSRDSRHKFCPDGHWLSSRAAISSENINVTEYVQNEGEASDNRKPLMSAINLRNLAILKYIPFTVSFLDRVRIFQRIINEDRSRSQSMEQRVLTAAGHNITVNRKYLYQDAFDQLSKDRLDDIKKVVRVQMVNTQGLEEAGIDGGGVFREFMSQLVKTGFDPSYGFFKTTSEQLLYPNPDVSVISSDYEKHLHFLGRILGKIIYESMMVELPLAEFFLCKLLNKHQSDVDIHHLESLDPELYKNLFYLKNYNGDADDLALNFTVMTSDYGETKLEELKPGGRDICVTNLNKIEYIHLMADYRLNKQIRSHVNAFRAGLSDVINIEWLLMFDHKELQILISGAPIEIDMEDLRMHTNYSGIYKADDDYIAEFWKLLSTLTDKQKRLFLKFVTSCSRPPLLGFSELYPKFCIHYGGEEDRLPTASTCMNFLKLPRYSSAQLLRTRLIYAIEAEAGFELS